ncbi:MAG: FliM/FliN family flagellar motor switch protein, partial [Mariprofundaceae bacterium]|nr:FliM/FliN family flagellar motor switch protein [Mariprofundaceae bacterium]
MSEGVVEGVEMNSEGARPNLEVIMHVPLEISVELGRVDMPLHAVTRLCRGTVVDLKKEANTEVNILANGQVFARGEVVTADGSWLIRQPNY